METLCRRSTPYCCNRSRSNRLSKFVFFFLINLCDIELDFDGFRDDGIELCPNTDSVHQLHSIDSLRLLACLRAVYRRRRQRHVTGYSNFASAVHKTLCQRLLHSRSQLLDCRRVLAGLSHRLLIFFFKPDPSNVAFNCDISCTRFYLAASFTAARSIRSLQCCNFVTAWKRFSDVQHSTAATSLRSKVSGEVLFFINLCDIELDNRRRA
jgi:hypothetical protein